MKRVPPFALWTGYAFVLVLLLALLVGCAPSAAYVAADRATYDAVAPAHRAYVQADAALTDEQKTRRLTTLETWELRIKSAEVKK